MRLPDIDEQVCKHVYGLFHFEFQIHFGLLLSFKKRIHVIFDVKSMEFYFFIIYELIFLAFLCCKNAIQCIFV